MADKKRQAQTTPTAPKKADIILQNERKISAAQNEVLNQTKLSNTKLDSVLEELAASRQDISSALAQDEALQENVNDGYASLKQELKILAFQNESIFTAISQKVEELEGLIQQAKGGLVYKEGSQIAEPVVDYDVIVDKLIARMPQQEGVRADIDYDLLADKLYARMGSQEVAATSAMPAAVRISEPGIDYEYLADKVVARIPAQEAVSPDYIASKVAEQLVAPQTGEIDYDLLSQKIAEKMPAADIDSEYIAAKISEQIVLPDSVTGAFDYDYLAAKVAEQIEIPEAQNVAAVAGSNYEVNEDELADAIALRVGSLKAEDFEILVDDEGCSSITKEIVDKLDYDVIAAAVAEKLRAALELAQDEEPDYDEMANRISERISIANVNSDEIADKAAAAISNYLPEYDTDEIADKVAEQVISALPASFDTETLSEAVSSKIIESQQDNDYEIVIDDDGVDRMSDSVSEKVYVTNDERFNAIDNDLAYIKELLENGKFNVVVAQAEPEEVEEPEEEIVEEAQEEPAEEVVTVSEVIQEVEEPEEEIAEETAEEVEEPQEEPEEEPAPAPVVIVAAADNDDEEDSDDGDLEGDENEEGVDFLNMMRYNRSFIARIIQSSDETKRYYGEVRNALLSYRKVNSNIAWGAERFHKGRETIARFKIRGKTLVLYLAIDPNEIEYSVYHQKDVSNNKSLHGTPTMIKVKSPRGVKKAKRLVDLMLEKRDGIKRNVPERDYAAMYPYETMEELIEDGLVKDVNKK